MSKNIDFIAGDDIVCIDNKYTPELKEGEVYKALYINKTKCCGNPIVDIGIKRNIDIANCITCNQQSDKNINFFSALRFKKLDNMVDISELTEILSNNVYQEI